MATLSSTYLNLIDIHQADSNIGPVINVLKKQNPILDDAVAQECNDGSAHEHSIMTGLPTPAWGRLYQGIPQSKATWQTVKDTTGFLEARAGVDTRALARAKNPAALRLSHAEAHLEAMNQEMATGLFYHDHRDHAGEVQGPRGALWRARRRRRGQPDRRCRRLWV